MFIASIFITVVLDYITKIYAQSVFVERHQVLGDYVYLEYLRNPWIAFSLPVQGLLLKIITIVLILWISYYYIYCEKKNLWTNLWYWVLLWGALWNAYERIVYWSVTDFIGVKYFSVFNFADSFIFIWVFILIILNYAKWRTESKWSKV